MSTPNTEERIVTCVYCGHAYQVGTPTHGAQVLTDHIKICEKHPLRDAEAKIKMLRSALEGLVGASTQVELEGMREVMKAVLTLQPNNDNAKAALAGIEALLKTL